MLARSILHRTKPELAWGKDLPLISTNSMSDREQ